MTGAPFILGLAFHALLSSQVCLGQSFSLSVSSVEAESESLAQLCERSGGMCVNTTFPTSVTDATDHPCRYSFRYDYFTPHMPKCTNGSAYWGACRTCHNRNFDFSPRTGVNAKVMIEDFRTRMDPKKLDTLMKMDSTDCLDRSPTGKWGVLTANALIELCCATVTRVENGCPLTEDGAACGKCKQGACIVPIHGGVRRPGEQCEVPPCEAAAQKCQFKFEGSDDEVPTFDLSFTAPDRPFTSKIVHKDSNIRIGIANSTTLSLSSLAKGRMK